MKSAPGAFRITSVCIGCHLEGQQAQQLSISDHVRAAFLRAHRFISPPHIMAFNAHGAAMSNEQPRKKRRMEAVSTLSVPAAGPPVSAINYKWNEKNVFHAINEGRFPADKIFDRPHYFALLDKTPVTRGHSLLITRHPVATMFEDKMPLEALADAMVDLQVGLCSGALQ
eukprot:GHUV01036853.1.p1 GENE.GHUV01036853.1~~GHUV01036853.1.p1  ORF type:complete len:170 (-),score=35.69 GHUV01036853.1:136-645(-)